MNDQTSYDNKKRGYTDTSARGYAKAMQCMAQGARAQKLFILSTRAPNQNEFDRGWQQACLEHGAKID